MPDPRLRIYFGPEADENVSTVPTDLPSKEQVTVPLKDIFPLLADAVSSERTWLSDFEDDEISISADLYEVILAYQYYRRPTG